VCRGFLATVPLDTQAQGFTRVLLRLCSDAAAQSGSEGTAVLWFLVLS
jgi:hypothetical protein